MRIYLSSTDKYKNEPLFETLVYLAKKRKMSGATVIRGIMGYGASSAVSSTRFWPVSEKLPMIVEIVDEKEKIEDFYRFLEPYLEKVNKGITVSVEKTRILLQKKGVK